MKNPEKFTHASTLAQKVGTYLLDNSANAGDLYEAAGQVYVAICESGIFAAKSDKARKEIRASILADLGRVVEHLRTWAPPSVEEFKAKHSSKFNLNRTSAGSKWDLN